ncbi:FMN-binding glutamate synthase family protein, partial [bacterium]|nr:FMN-binding glutamate synthase family protein [bacterium]
WDHMLFDACQVTNPSIDPLREPMEMKSFLGKKPAKLEIEEKDGEPSVKTEIAPQLTLDVPVMFAAMSYGSINLNVVRAEARAAEILGTYYNTGEGGLHRELYKYGNNTIVQVASGRFGVHTDYLNAGAAVEIKIGQGAKPGIGGHLPGEKINEEVAKTRMIPVGTDAISPAPQHDIYSIEDLRQLIYALKEATEYTKPISVKIAAVHNIAAIASGIARAGADIIAIDGFRGGTGSAPTVIRDNVGIPIELAAAAVDTRLREEGIRNSVSLVVSGGIRNSGDVLKAIILGADAVYIGTPVLMACGCTLCQKCHTGKCCWGITTNDPLLAKRVNPDIATEKIVNLITGWKHEIQEIMGLLGVNSLESIKGSRIRLRGVGLSDTDLEILGIPPRREIRFNASFFVKKVAPPPKADPPLAEKNFAIIVYPHEYSGKS